MAVVLDAIKRAGDKGNDRQAVIDQFFATKDRDSVLGTYSINENGDTTLTDYGAQRVEGGKLEFDKVIKAQATQESQTRGGRRGGVHPARRRGVLRPKRLHGSRIRRRRSARAPGPVAWVCRTSSG